MRKSKKIEISAFNETEKINTLIDHVNAANNIMAELHAHKMKINLGAREQTSDRGPLNEPPAIRIEVWKNVSRDK